MGPRIWGRPLRRSPIKKFQQICCEENVPESAGHSEVKEGSNDLSLAAESGGEVIAFLRRQEISRTARESQTHPDDPEKQK